MIYYVEKPCGQVLAYSRLEKAQRVADLYGVALIEKPTKLQEKKAQWNEWR